MDIIKVKLDDKESLVYQFIHKYRMTHEFHKTFELYISDPNEHQNGFNYDSNLVDLRYRLLREELQELKVAIEECDRIEILDAITDINYIINGTYISFGLYSFCMKDEIDEREFSMLAPLLRAMQVSSRILMRTTDIGDLNNESRKLANLVLYTNKYSESIHGYMMQNQSKVKASDLIHFYGKIETLVYEIALMYGLDDVLFPAYQEVHRSNMSKLDADGNVLKNEYGKVIKSDIYSKPNLTQFIKS